MDEIGKFDLSGPRNASSTFNKMAVPLLVMMVTRGPCLDQDPILLGAELPHIRLQSLSLTLC